MKTKQHAGRFLCQAAAVGWLAWAGILPTQADYSNTVMSFNPVGYWPLTEPAGPPVNYGTGTATNSGYLGPVANGTYYRTPTLGAPGVLANDSCVTLDGTSQYIDVPYNPVLNTNGPFTVEFWANQTFVAQGAKSGVMSYNGSSGFLFYTDNNTAHWAFRVFYGTGRVYFGDIGPLNEANTWYHVVGIFDGSYVHLLVNGVENTPPVLMPTNYVPVVAGTPLRIGGANPAGNPSSYFNGSLDEVAIYPYALSTDQVAAHYAAGISGDAVAYRAQILADNPAGYWRFNEPGPLPLPPTSVTVTVTNYGSWGTGANGVLNALPNFNTGRPGVPYKGFGTNTSCQFAGNGTYIQVPPQNLVTDNFTITCWTIITNTQQSAWTQLFGSPDLTGKPTGLGFGGSGSPGMIFNSMSVYWTGDLGSLGGYGGETTPVLYEPYKQWAFMAMVANTNDMVVYVNGQTGRRTPGTATYGAHNFSETNLFLGNGIMGSLAQVAVFDHALTSNELAQIYAAAQPPPIILAQPVAPPPPVYEGTSLALSVQADEGLIPVTYQWFKSGIPLSGQTAMNLVISTLATNDSGNYAVVVSNPYASVTSSVVALTVLSGPPLIAQEPQSIQRYAGATATFSVTAHGSSPLSYQWSLNGTPISGATSSALTLTDVRAGDAGNYSVLITNPYGTTNAQATLTLLTATKLAAVVTERTPLGYWRLDETSGTVAYDYMGGRDGTLRTGVTNNVPGPEPTAFQGFDPGNKAYALNGAGGYVTVPAFGVINGAMTIVAWIKPEAVQSDYAGLVFTRGGGGNTSGLSYTQGGQLGYTWNDAAASYNWQSQVFPTADQWNFVALVVEPTQATLYLDRGFGLETTVNTLAHGASTWSGVRLGSDPYGGRDFKGSLDDVAVYASALPTDEIENIRKAGVNGIYAPAKTYRWKGPNGANWSVAGNWNNTVPGASDIVVLSDSSSAGATVNLNTDVTVGGLTFNNKVANQTIASTSGRTLALSGGGVEVPAGTLSISCPIDATANGLSKSGSGTLNIAGPMQVTYQPPNAWVRATVSGITLSGTGSWTAVNDFSVMNVVGTVTVNDSATLDWSSGVTGIALRGGDAGILVQNGGLVKGQQTSSGWSCCAGPGLILGSQSYFGAGPSDAEYDLNGGILQVASIYNINEAWDVPPLPPNGSAVFRFNGGVLRATQSDPSDPIDDAGVIKEGCTNLMGNLSHAYVGLGGAKIDVATFSCGINQALEHDPALGATPDGGLRAMSTGGPGTLALYQLSSFTGPLAIDTGVTVQLGYAGDQQVAGVSIGGVDQGTGTFGVGHKNPNGVFTGTGTVTVVPALPSAPTLPTDSFSLTSGGVPTFTDVPTTAGYTYWLTYKNKLTDPTWTRIGTGTAGGGNKTFIDTVTPYPAYRFYQLEVQ